MYYFPLIIIPLFNISSFFNLFSCFFFGLISFYYSIFSSIRLEVTHSIIFLVVTLEITTGVLTYQSLPMYFHIHLQRLQFHVYFQLVTAVMWFNFTYILSHTRHYCFVFRRIQIFLLLFSLPASLNFHLRFSFCL